jgi:hypothetical protein
MTQSPRPSEATPVATTEVRELLDTGLRFG